MSRSRKMSAKGRSTGREPFVMLPHWVFDSPAYRSLKPGPRALLWEINRRFNGFNNGKIAFSQRDMAIALNISDRETIAGYARELVAKGFIKAVRVGGFNVKVSDRRASEWALTWLRVDDQPASREFIRRSLKAIDGAAIPRTEDGIPGQVQDFELQERAYLRNFPSLPPRLSV